MCVCVCVYAYTFAGRCTCTHNPNSMYATATPQGGFQLPDSNWLSLHPSQAISYHMYWSWIPNVPDVICQVLTSLLQDCFNAERGRIALVICLPPTAPDREKVLTVLEATA